jgi:hypothetical protein
MPASIFREPWNRSIINVFGHSRGGKTRLTSALRGCTDLEEDDCWKADAVHFDTQLPPGTASFLSECEANYGFLLKESLLACVGNFHIKIRDFTHEKLLNTMLPIFVRERCINLLVFDASRMKDELEVDNCLDELLGSFQLLCMNYLRGHGALALFALVGTTCRKLQQGELNSIAKLLTKRLGSHSAWIKWVFLCELKDYVTTTSLPYFPIDVVRGSSVTAPQK